MPHPDDHPTAERIRRWIERHGTRLAFTWGFAEATLFFLVPDVAITAIALFGLRRGLRAAGAALAGALLGGALLYGIAGQVGPEIMPFFDKVPAISDSMIEAVHDESERLGPMAAGIGPLTGKPYKLYAANSGAHDRGLLALLLWTVPARGLRFFPAALVTGLLAGWVRRKNWLGTRGLLLCHLAFWVTVYVAYLLTVGI